MGRATHTPTFTANVPGPWGVDSIGDSWYVIHRRTLAAKCIGPIGGRRANYFDRAIAEADQRNRIDGPDDRIANLLHELDGIARRVDNHYGLPLTDQGARDDLRAAVQRAFDETEL